MAFFRLFAFPSWRGSTSCVFLFPKLQNFLKKLGFFSWGRIVVLSAIRSASFGTSLNAMGEFWLGFFKGSIGQAAVKSDFDFNRSACARLMESRVPGILTRPFANFGSWKEVPESLFLLPASAVFFVTANPTVLRSFFGLSFTVALPRPDNKDSETSSSACESSLFGVFVVEIRLYLGWAVVLDSVSIHFDLRSHGDCRYLVFQCHE